MRATLRRWRHEVRDIIYGHDTFGGRAFDGALVVVILASVAVVMLDSVVSVSARHGHALHVAEWVFTLLFTAEYLLRVWSARDRRGYALSFYGAIDLLAVIPTYASIVFPAGRFLVTLRVFRVLRVFRILKLGHYVSEASVLSRAVRASRYKITVFLFVVISVAVVVGALMYLIEGGGEGFTSIPQSMYWAIVTLTTVGYGDVAPHTALGKLLASALMVLGYGIIAVPTGIMTLEIERASRPTPSRHICPACRAEGHDADAHHCKHCGERL
jgi:voltage-gated potassium channel